MTPDVLLHPLHPFVVEEWATGREWVAVQRFGTSAAPAEEAPLHALIRRTRLRACARDRMRDVELAHWFGES